MNLLYTVPPRPPTEIFSKDTVPTEIYTPSLHDALPICRFLRSVAAYALGRRNVKQLYSEAYKAVSHYRSEEHTSELQSRGHLVCRLLLEKKKKEHSGAEERPRI